MAWQRHARGGREVGFLAQELGGNGTCARKQTASISTATLCLEE